MQSIVAIVVLIVFFAVNSNAELYGKLLSNNDKYEFEKVSNFRTEDKLVNLSNNSPVNFYTPAKEGCSSSIWNMCGLKTCKDNDFVDNKTRVRETAFLYTVGLIAFPFPLLCGGVIIPREANFDYDRFYAAVREASASSDIDKIKEDYRNFDVGVSASKGKITSKLQEAKSIYNRYRDEFSGNILKLKREIKVSDLSGFWQKDPSVLVDVDFGGFDFENNFLANVPSLRTKISASPQLFRNELKSMEAENNRTTSVTISNIELNLKRYEQKASESAKYVYVINKSKNSYDGFDYKVIVPDKIVFGATQDKLTINVQIDTKNFKGVYPHYKHNDKNLSIVSDGNLIKLINNTDEFLQLHSVSIYYGKEISSNYLDKPIELPPRSEKIESVSRFTTAPNFMNVANYPRLTKNEAKKTYFEYGIAAKYRMVNQNVDKTLYMTKKYNLLDVINSSL